VRVQVDHRPAELFLGGTGANIAGIIEGMTQKIIPSTLTSYDLLKTFAVLTMVMDHIGAEIYPDENWWRVVGRMSAPVWLFLIGYARSRDVSPMLWVGVVVIALTNFVVGQAILPLCILATILAARFAIDPVMAAIKTNPVLLYPIAFVAFVMSLPVAAIVDYGSEIFLMVMLGYITRNRHELSFMGKERFLVFACVAASSHILYQTCVFFNFDQTQSIVAAAGIFMVTLALTCFKPAQYESLDAALPRAVAGLFKLCGRRSLEIYVVHLVFLKGLGAVLGVGSDTFFNFHIY
jgi:hypothetical protein